MQNALEILTAMGYGRPANESTGLSQLDGMLPFQLLIQEHNARLGLLVFSEQELLEVFAVEVFQPAQNAQEN